MPSAKPSAPPPPETSAAPLPTPCIAMVDVEAGSIRLVTADELADAVKAGTGRRATALDHRIGAPAR